MVKKAIKNTATKKSGRGGSRPGAGRKPKPRNLTEAPKTAVRAISRVRPAKKSMQQTDQTDLARKYAKLSLDALADVAANGNSENARISAATSLLEWGFGKPMGIGSGTLRPGAEKSAKAKPLGKKEQLKQDALNPDANTEMGSLMAARAAQAAKLNS